MAEQRDLSLYGRKENTRDGNIKKFNLEEILEHFNENMKTIQEQHEIADELDQKDEYSKACDVWRAQIVFLESAFDFFLHELVKLGIISFYFGDWEGKNDHYYKLTVSLEEVEKAVRDTENDQWLLDWIDKKYSQKTLISEDSFCQVCNLLGISIEGIARRLSLPGSKASAIGELKNWIETLYNRRNKIAHQSDRESGNAEKQPIAKEDVLACQDGIQKIVNAMCDEIKKKRIER